MELKFAFTALLALFLISSLHAATLGAQGSRDIMVKWRTLPPSLDACELLPSFADQIACIRPALPTSAREQTGLERIHIIALSTVENRDDLLSELRGDPRVEYAEPRPIRYTDGFSRATHEFRNPLDGVPNDPFYNAQWALDRIDMPSAWDITRGDSNVVIAVVDVGTWFDHPELSGQRWRNMSELNGTIGIDDDGNGYTDDFYGYDFVDENGDPTPFPLDSSQSHGTHVAGIAAAIRNNGQGIAGVAPGCRIMAVRVGSGGSIPYGYEGIYYACRAGAKVINCSWGGEGESAYEHDIISYAISQGCIVVASAGNEGTSTPHFPAGIEGAVSVAATGITDNAAYFTKYGPWVKVSAPGVEIISTVIAGFGVPAYDVWQGTSMSAPYVAGVLALVASRYPQMSGAAVAQRVISSCDPIDAANPNLAGQLGAGRINAWRALADSVSGVRLAAITYEETSGNGDGRIREGESAEIRVAVMNDLAPIENVYGQISTPDDSVSITSTLSLYGDVPSGGPFWNSQPAFRIELPIGSPRARILPLVVDWFDAQDHLLGRASLHVELDSTYVEVNNGRMTLGFAENGCLGYADYEHGIYLGPGLRVEGRPSNALYHGSFLVAADGLVSDNSYGNAELNRFDWLATPDSVAHVVPASRSDAEFHASFEDRQAEQMLFARVNAAALAWYGDAEDGFLVLEYNVTNRSINPWNETYAGFFFDWDLGASSRNLSHFDTLSQLAYVSQAAPGHPLVGVVPLNDSWQTYYVVNNRSEIDPPSDWSDARKWQLLTGGIAESPEIVMDLSHLVAVGPFTVPAHDSLLVSFAIVVGNDLSELRANAAAAGAHYSGLRQKPSPPHVSNWKRVPGLYPNPLPPESDLQLVLPESEAATVRFYNILGQQIADLHLAQASDVPLTVDRTLLRGASGLLFYHVSTGSREFSGKLLLLK